MCDDSDSDCDTSFSTGQHRYNTRLSAKKCTGQHIYQHQEQVGASRSRRNQTKLQFCREINPNRTLDSSIMDFNYAPCPQRPSGEPIWCKIAKAILMICIISILGYTIYEVHNIREELQTIKGGHRKAKMKELDKRCSESLKLLLKDPTGRPDFALESTGGRVVSVNADVYISTKKTFMGMTLCEGQHGPKSMIQASTAPGECWAFKGQSAKAIIELIGEILVDAVSLEHIPSNISPSGNIDTAPKDFKIWGLKDSQGSNRKLLGVFKYEVDGGSIQTFPIENNTEYYRYIEFEVVSNHGNAEFTCVYRLRVHGTARYLTRK